MADHHVTSSPYLTDLWSGRRTSITTLAAILITWPGRPEHRRAGIRTNDALFRRSSRLFGPFVCCTRMYRRCTWPSRDDTWLNANLHLTYVTLALTHAQKRLYLTPISVIRNGPSQTVTMSTNKRLYSRWNAPKSIIRFQCTTQLEHPIITAILLTVILALTYI